MLRTPGEEVAMSKSPSLLIKGMFDLPVPGGKPCRVSEFIA